MADYIQAFLARIGLSCVRDAHDNLLTVIEPQQPGPAADTLHLSGHTDTVVPVEGWTSVIRGRRWSQGSGDEQRIAALGTSDMKSGLAVMLHLAQACRGQKKSLEAPASRGVFYRLHEEGPAKGKRNGVHDILKLQPGRWAITTEASCDESCPTLAVGCQGHAVAKIKLTGRSAHSACPENGLNAIHAAAKICARVEKLNASFKSIVVLGDVRARRLRDGDADQRRRRGGEHHSLEHCELTISRRIASPAETTADFEKGTAPNSPRISDGVAAALGCALRCARVFQRPAGRAVEKARPRREHGALLAVARYSWNRARTDLVLFKQAGMDVLNIGPGYTGQAHVRRASMCDWSTMPRSANLILGTIEKTRRFAGSRKKK